MSIDEQMDRLNLQFGVWARKEWGEVSGRWLYVISVGDRAQSFAGERWSQVLSRYHKGVYS